MTGNGREVSDLTALVETQTKKSQQLSDVPWYHQVS